MTQRAASLSADVVAILETADPMAKSARAMRLAEHWPVVTAAAIGDRQPPPRPGRPKRPELLVPGKVPRRRINRGIKGRVALLHALAHIELNAIDLACDIIARFAAVPNLPMAFFDDWIAVASDEARHFRLLNARLSDFEATYGDLPAHDGLWEAAENTAHDLLARLAVVPLVLEARGLDVTPEMIRKLREAEDEESAGILEVIHRDEITHVAAGQRWFAYLCKERRVEPTETFHLLVKRYFRGELKPPFNRQSRDLAGVPEAYYSN